MFEMSCEESVSYSKSLEKLEKIRHTNDLSLATLPVDNERRGFVTSSVIIVLLLYVERIIVIYSCNLF
jgi:hypothetical protein